MTLQSNAVATRYLIMPGPEAFTLTQGTNAPVTVNYCRRTDLTYTDLQWSGAAQLGLQPQDLVIYVPGPELPSGIAIESGNTLTDSNGVAYTVQVQPKYNSFTQKYRLICRKNRIA